MSSTHDQATSLFSEYIQTVERIRSDKATSREGKRADLARTYLNTRAKMDGIFATEATHRADRKRELERQLFGAPLLGDQASMMISRRDAMDRTSRLKNSDEARDLLALSMASGDEVLTRAVAQWAYQQRDLDVVNTYLEARPQHDAAFNELWVLPGSQRDPIEEARRHMSFPVDKPRELADIDEMHLPAVADGRELAQTA